MVTLDSREIHDITADVDRDVGRGDVAADERDATIAEREDKAYAAKAREGEFFSTSLDGMYPSMLRNATPSEWASNNRDHEGPFATHASAFVATRLFEVRPTIGTNYYEGYVGAQGRPYHADLPGGGTQVLITDKSDRDDWSVRAVARTPDEFENLPKRDESENQSKRDESEKLQASVKGYASDGDGDLRITPPDAHAGDSLVATHHAWGGKDPFEAYDDARRAHDPVGWDGPTRDKFSGSVQEKVIGAGGDRTHTPRVDDEGVNVEEVPLSSPPGNTRDPGKRERVGPVRRVFGAVALAVSTLLVGEQGVPSLPVTPQVSAKAEVPGASDGSTLDADDPKNPTDEAHGRQPHIHSEPEVPNFGERPPAISGPPPRRREDDDD